jgi:hypothetical protein
MIKKKTTVFSSNNCVVRPHRKQQQQSLIPEVFVFKQRRDPPGILPSDSSKFYTKDTASKRINFDSKYPGELSSETVPQKTKRFQEGEACKKVHPRITNYQKVDTDLDLPKGILKIQAKDDEAIEKERPSMTYYQKVDTDHLTKSTLKPDILVDIEKSTRHVSFGYVEIREYERIVGDNPSRTHGPPISIGWNYRQSAKFRVDNYEKMTCRSCQQNQRLLSLSSVQRIKLLTAYWDCSEEEILVQLREAASIQCDRVQSLCSGSSPAHTKIVDDSNCNNGRFGRHSLQIPLNCPGRKLTRESKFAVKFNAFSCAGNFDTKSRPGVEI